MNKEGNKLTLLTSANLYPRFVRTVVTLIGSFLVLGPTIDEKGWDYIWTTPSVLIGLVGLFVVMLLTGMKPGEV